MWENAADVIAKYQWAEEVNRKTRNRHLMDISNQIYFSKRNKETSTISISIRAIINSLMIGRNLGMITSMVIKDGE